jgi:RNA polymerase sigma-70 factor (ECF subfamily)
VFRIARNVLLDERRRRDRSLLDRVNAFESDAHGDLAGRDGPQHLQASLRQALSALPEDERAAFLMREAGGLGYEEIAAATECSKDAVRMRIYRARLALRQALAPPPPSGPCLTTKEHSHDE